MRHRHRSPDTLSFTRRLEQRAAAASAAPAAPAAAPPFRDNGLIKLQNPVEEHYEAFIFGNAVKCQRQPTPHEPGVPCTDAACSVVVERDSALGQHLVLCGAGPSLAEHAAAWCPQGDQVWGCNSAMTYLHERGHKVTHGFAVDQTAEMLREWATAPDVEYLIATTVHPHLTDFLIGKGRRTRFFHNYCGIKKPHVKYASCITCGVVDGGHGLTPTATCAHSKTKMQMCSYEDWLYQALFPSTVRSGSGLNSVNRALDVALYMGFARITILGADCSLRVSRPLPEGVVSGSPEHRAWMENDVVMHADGGHGGASNSTMMTFTGEIDGRMWTTKPDLVISAVWLEKARQASFILAYDAEATRIGYAVEQLTEAQRLAVRLAVGDAGGRVEIVGDTLPQALKDKPDAFLQRMPSMDDMAGKPMEVARLGQPIT